jgi:hypothetical protein
MVVLVRLTVLGACGAWPEPGQACSGFTLHELTPDRRLSIGPFVASICLLPHWVPNAGLRLAAGGTVLAYTGDSGPDPAIIGLARDADLLLAEATFAAPVPLNTLPQAGAQSYDGPAAAGYVLCSRKEVLAMFTHRQTPPGIAL